LGKGLEETIHALLQYYVPEFAETDLGEKKFPAEIPERNPQSTDTNHIILVGRAIVVSAEFHGMLNSVVMNNTKFVFTLPRSNLVML
jgi:hypothetical protein